MYQLTLVAVGGGVGAVLRHFCNLAALRIFGTALPIGTLLVNVAGSFFIGLCVEVITRRFGDMPELRLFIATGFLGGFTTFSAFSLDVVVLLERGEFGYAFCYGTMSVVFSILAAFAGLWVARYFA